MQTNSITHPFRVLWLPVRGGYHAKTRYQSFVTEGEARTAAQPIKGHKVVVQKCDGNRYLDLA
jgi:hypothetical protein